MVVAGISFQRFLLLLGAFQINQSLKKEEERANFADLKEEESHVK